MKIVDISDKQKEKDRSCSVEEHLKVSCANLLDAVGDVDCMNTIVIAIPADGQPYLSFSAPITFEDIGVSYVVSDLLKSYLGYELED